MLNHRPQILEVEQQQAIVVGNPEHQLQHTRLRVVEIQQPRQQTPAPCPKSSRAPDAPARRKRPRKRPDISPARAP
jgi:hypothetical protein